MKPDHPKKSKPNPEKENKLRPLGLLSAEEKEALRAELRAALEQMKKEDERVEQAHKSEPDQ